MRILDYQGEKISELGIGTWYLGEGSEIKTAEEITAMKYALDRGINMIDTAEMYGNGLAEELVGKVIKDYKREDILLTSKFYPHNASKGDMRQSLEASLKRLQTDYLDTYMLHWRSDEPLEETVAGLNELQQEGLIRHWGVSNFDVDDMKELLAVEGGDKVAANEVLYNIESRGIEYDLMPFQKEKDIALVGYSPFGSGFGDSIAITNNLKEIAETHQATPHQILLAWVIRDHNLITIPKAAKVGHMQENIAASDIVLSPDELAVLDQDYPAPDRKMILKVI
ncbi:aldo/keto reductase [Holzapfeliella floricola]|uniref:NADP-dependent oxidoreductase domain-containing protein n=1 Tax=Holzapfeliella floricola DSM 23037 = JCM 16512 TaxID=1423744 RepID=A0A0R2DJ64_9LACO|nr:aldo/keto reductase [Holzapfeliella floricola]KRN04089.1 hypothetical protein FC86_GL000461 [Holzapfeliella floricola DSM 23037 = JCM 16512]